MSSNAKIAAVALAVLLAAALAGCGTGQAPKEAGNGAGSAGPNPSAGGSPSPSASMSTASPAPSAKPEPNRIQTKLTGFQWVDGKSGYAWGTTGDNLRIYRTDDSGKNWTAVTPQGNDIKTGSPDNGRSLFFLDAQHGWISSFVQDRPNLTLRTANGGREWQSSPLDKTTYPAAVAFITTELGWLMTSSDTAMGSSEKTLYATRDGGATWQAVTETQLPPNGDAKTGALPLAGTVQGIAFKDASHGWLPLASPAEVPLLYRTQDAGRTWAKTDLPIPENKSGVPISITAAPKFFPKDERHGWFPVRSIAADKPSIDAYVTSDGGEHWSFQAFGMQQAVTFLDSKHGWGWKDGALYRTTDSGTTWTRIPANGVLADKLKDYPEPLAAQFITTQTGWLLIGSTDGKKSLLLKTEDGGAAWTVV